RNRSLLREGAHQRRARAGAHSVGEVWLEDVLQRADERRQHVLAVERVVVPEDRQAAVLPVDARLPPLGIDDTYDLRARAEPVGHLGEHLGWSVVRRQDLGERVWR